MKKRRLKKPLRSKRVVEISYTLLITSTFYFCVLTLLVPLRYVFGTDRSSGASSVEVMLLALKSYIDVTFVIFIYLSLVMMLAGFMGWGNLEKLHKRGATARTAFRAWKRMLAGIVILLFAFPYIGYWSILGDEARIINTFSIWWQNDWGFYLIAGSLLAAVNMYWTKRYIVSKDRMGADTD